MGAEIVYSIVEHGVPAERPRGAAHEWRRVALIGLARAAAAYCLQHAPCAYAERLQTVQGGFAAARNDKDPRLSRQPFLRRGHHAPQLRAAMLYSSNLAARAGGGVFIWADW